ncbi:hypothetical protein PanWU01x14_036070 [Parasponia andersonii]|uniref:Uncharacterized protein n=1 Tax=Parasponia andersonii TaxID=3476 RepID=A0A2P5DSE1_PARAD|nr:hypothetical protein PanWU01x14_036070 [Parasponia andersonii]
MSSIPIHLPERKMQKTKKNSIHMQPSILTITFPLKAEHQSSRPSQLIRDQKKEGGGEDFKKKIKQNIIPLLLFPHRGEQNQKGLLPNPRKHGEPDMKKKNVQL